MSSRGIPEHRWFLRYALPVASVGLATAITLALTGPAKRTPLFYAAILLAAWYGGTGPALLAVGLAALARQYYFTPPFHTLAIGSVEHLAEMFIFILTGLVLTVFARVQHRTQAALRQAHAELEARNQSLALSNQRLQAEIEERRQAEAEVRKQASLLDLTRDSMFVMDLNTVITYWNRGAEEKYGWTRDEAVGRVSYELLQTVFPVSLAEIKAELHRTGGWDGELVHTARDGTRIVAASRWSLQRDAAGHPIGYLETNTDMTERRQAEEALRRSEAHLAEAQRLSQIGSWVWDAAAGKLTHSSEEHARLLGLDLGATRSFGAWRDRIHPEDRERVLHAFDDAIRQRMNCQLEYRVVRPDGSMSYIQSVGHPVLDSSGELVELVGTDMDVTERRRAEQERQEHLRFFENMDRVNRAIQGTNDLERMMSEVLDAVLEIFEADRAWLVYPCDPQAESWRAVMEHTRPEFPGAFAVGTALPVDTEVAKVFSSARASSGPVVFGPAYGEVPVQLAQRYSIQSIMAMAIHPKGDQPYLFGLHQCSYPRVWTPAEERLFREIGRRLTDALTSLVTFRNLQESQARLKEAQHIAHLGYFTREVETGNYTLSEETCRIVGLEPQDGPVPLDTLWAVIHPEDRQREEQLVEEAIAAGRPYDVECRLVLPSGEVRIVQTRGSPLSDESGRVRRVFGIMQDITERKRAEEALQQAQSQLAHVTRMVTLGELTASIAHEVNQPLAAVVANGNACRRWLEAVPPNLDEAREALRHIISNGNRASDVVRRIRGLLQRQTPEKERVEVNELVRGALALTRNELARQQVLVRTELSPDLPTIVADRGGLEQVLVNLIVNAIDAMTGASEPKVLTVASRAEGSAVRVEVRDRGKGCDPEQLRRMFDPFYSTKDDGLGMGLAISRSIVEAHAGQLWAAPNDDAGLTLQFTLTAPAGNGA